MQHAATRVAAPVHTWPRGERTAHGSRAHWAAFLLAVLRAATPPESTGRAAHVGSILYSSDADSQLCIVDSTSERLKEHRRPGCLSLPANSCISVCVLCPSVSLLLRIYLSTVSTSQKQPNPLQPVSSSAMNSPSLPAACPAFASASPLPASPATPSCLPCSVRPPRRPQAQVPRRARTRLSISPSPSPPASSNGLPSSSSSPSPELEFSSSRVRSSSPRSKRRYISRLRETLSTRCAKADNAFWSAMQAEARLAAEGEPLLASFLFSTVLNHRSLNNALAFHLANKLASPAMPSTMLMRLFQDTIATDNAFCENVRHDLLAVMERDPACMRFIDALLYFKGFHALQAYRVAHSLWNQGRIPLAFHLQSQVSKELQVDIHPAAVIGAGAFFDHATGVVIGETAVIGNNVSMLHHVTLGGSGKTHGDRHPKLGDGVLVGAGATVLGNVTVGEGAQIGACSLVLEDIPPHSTVVGVPAKVVNRQGMAVPALDMKHERCLPGCTDESHGHGDADREPTVTAQVADSVNGMQAKLNGRDVEGGRSDLWFGRKSETDAERVKRDVTSRT